LQERFGRAPRGFPNAKFHKNATAQEKPGLHRRPRLQRRESLSGIGQSCLAVLPASPPFGRLFRSLSAPSRRALLSTLSPYNPMRCPEPHTTAARSSTRPPLHSPPCAVTYVN